MNWIGWLLVLYMVFVFVPIVFKTLMDKEAAWALMADEVAQWERYAFWQIVVSAIAIIAVWFPYICARIFGSDSFWVGVGIALAHTEWKKNRR